MNDDGDVALISIEHLAHGVRVANIGLDMPVIVNRFFQMRARPTRRSFIAEEAPAHVIVDADDGEAHAGKLVDRLGTDEARFTRAEASLPETGFVFCCFNNNYKILPDFFDSWMRILNRAEHSVLWLFEDNPAAATNLRKEAIARGVAADRLVFARRMQVADHLARHKLADLFLDTRPYNAHVTASDALWAGVPILTCMGDTFVGRVAASLLKAVGLPELIASNPEQYERTAIELANDPDRLQAIKAKLAHNQLTTPLFETKLFTRNIERAYEAITRRVREGLPPEPLVISSPDVP